MLSKPKVKVIPRQHEKTINATQKCIINICIMCLFVVNRSSQLLNNELKQFFENQSSG